MQDYYNDQLDLTKSRLLQLEKELILQQNELTMAVDQIKETQRFLIKLAQSQAEIAKRVSSWPFVAVDARGDENA